MAGYNKARFVQDLLQKTEGKPPSFTINLHPDHWSLNNGSRFHYHIPMASLLDDIRAQRIPPDFLEIFDSARIPYYEGCLVVQILDFRPQNPKDAVLEKPEQARVVLHPNSETLWADICSLNQRYGSKWTDMDALEVEARLLLATTPPLCLDPNPHLAKIANHVMRASMPTIPAPLKRKAAAMEPEDDELDKARRIKIIQHMATAPNRTTPSFHLFDALQKARENLAKLRSLELPPPAPPQQPSSQYNPGAQSSPAPPAPVQPGTPTVNGVQPQSPSELPDDKKRKRRKSETSQTSFGSSAFTRTNGTPTPAPSSTAHQFVNSHPPPPTTASSPAPNVQSPMQIPMYTNMPGTADSTLRVPTPAQQQPPQYTRSPRPPSKTPAPAAHPQPPPQPQPQPHPNQNVHHTPQNPKPPLPTSVPNYPPQPTNQQFLPTAQPAPNGVQKHAIPANLTAAARAPQGQNLTTYQQQQMHLYAQIRNMQQQQAQARLQAQKPNGRATPQANVPSPAPQPQAALSPVHQGSSPSVAHQPLAARSPIPPHASQAAPGIPKQQQMQQSPAQMAAHQVGIPRSVTQPNQQQPIQPGQHPGYPQFNIRGMVPTNPPATHQSLQNAVTNAGGRARTPGGGIPDHHQHAQHPKHSPHPPVPGQPQPSQRPPSRTPQPPPQQSTPNPTHQPQPPAAQHPQQPQQPLTQAQMQQLYPQLYGYPFNMPGTAGRMPQAYWGNMGVQGMPNMANMAGMPGVQGIPGMQGVQGMGGIPPGMMTGMQGMQGMGRGLPMGAQQMVGMAAPGAGVGHVPGTGGAGPMQGKAAGIQR